MDMSEKEVGKSIRASDAPEIDTSLSAPQHYPLVEGLQICENSTPGLQHYARTEGLQVHETNAPTLQHYPLADGLQPVIDGLEPVSGNANASIAISSPTFRRLPWRVIVLISVVTCVTLISIALGVGLSMGLHDNEAPSSPSITVPNGTLKNGILSDTSLAAVRTSEGNRHIFYQDVNGSLRHVIFDPLANSWLYPSDIVITTSLPRHLTPLAAVELNTIPNTIHLFFINTDNFLAAVAINKKNNPPPMSNSFDTAQGSRTLSVAQMAPSEKDSFSEAVLFYESPNHNITSLRGYYYGNASQWLWENVSETVYSSVSDSKSWLSSPLGASSELFSRDNQQSVTIAYFNPNTLIHGTAAPLYQAQFNNWSGLLPTLTPSGATAAFPAMLESGNATAAVRESDLISYYFNTNDFVIGAPTANGSIIGEPITESCGALPLSWVQNQSLISSCPIGKPGTSYPFSRLAWLNDSNVSVTYFYHQMNNEVLAEDAYYALEGWKTDNITIKVNS